MLAAALYGVLSLQTGAWAESVSVNSNKGQGLVFRHHGLCYLIFPEHVRKANGSQLVSLSTAYPVLSGSGILLDISPGPGRSIEDLSVAYVREELGERCSLAWEDLPDDVSPKAKEGNQLSLLWIASGGVEKRTTVEIEQVDTFMIHANVKGGVFEGRSGGILYAQGTPIGMAVEGGTPDQPDKATFMRMDQIKRLIAAVVEQRGIPAEDPPVAAATSSCGPSQIPLATIVCDRESTTPDLACRNILAQGPAVFPADALPLTVRLGFQSKDPVAVSRIAISAGADDQTLTVPKEVEVYVDNADDDPRYFSSGLDMTPLGRLEVVNGSEPSARRAIVVIKSTWDAGKPFRIDCVAAYSSAPPQD